MVRSELARRRRVLVLGAGTTAVLCSAVLALSSAVKSPAQVAAETEAPGRTVLTAPVERRVLNDTVVLRGTVVQAHTIAVEPAAVFESERMVVTAVRVKARQAVKAGQILVEVSGRPVVVLPGAFPAYRDIRPGARGKDVAQLQAALRKLGYRVARESVFGPSTKAALTRLYDSLGYPVPHTGTADQQAVEQAELRVRDAQRALDEARDAAGGSGPAVPGAPDVDDMRAALDQARRDLADLVARTGPMLPMGEVVFVPAFPVRVVKVTAVVGRAAQGALLTLATGDVVAAGTLPGSDPQGIEVGMPAEILHSADGRTQPGRVTAVGEAATALLATGSGQTSGEEDTAGQGQSSGGLQQGYPVVITATKPLDPKLVGQSVRLSVVVASSGEPTLVVPVAAVSAGGDGAVSVRVVGADDEPRTVRVTVGSSGDGYVEVIPVDGALREGDRVVVGVS
ncbi:peptidoglycan-binding protein [Phytohabitans rumicis]|uniref:Peptidoglycan binding-like domain-containing protein n=1 Tax=Phytohabitans rumicis TaxID=1076125 RepID=A0A6V8LAW1_9ACTN|nr:peptidoglycan-binding protein [Phytohabitans rumicis]GFJ91207.1 hypothetical protein Prum_048490 [Phytohabitans rumicis]